MENANWARNADDDLWSAESCIRAASGSAEAAKTYAHETEINALVDVVSDLVSELRAALPAISDAKTTTEAYQGELEALST